MDNVPKYLFSMPLTLESDDVSSKIPRLHTAGYKLMSARLGEDGDRRFLAAVANGRPTVLSARSLVRAVAKVDNTCRVAICSPYLDHGIMRTLASEGIAYIKDSGNVFLPFLGMVASPVPEGRKAGPLSPHAQRVVLGLVSGRWDGLAAGELAAAMEVSRSTVSKCLAEIEAILPSALSVEWKRRVLRNPGMSRGGLLDAFEPFLVSPVKGRKLLKGRGALEVLNRAGALLSGESALPYYSDLAHGRGVVRVALLWRDVPSIMESAGNAWSEIEWFEEPDVVVEEWAYVPDGRSRVSLASTGFESLDALGLFAEMKDADEGDARLADAIAQLREAACRE